MTDIAICVENLSKVYHIGRARQRHDTLRDALSAALHPASRAARREDETLWALRDVSFEVQRGEVVGIIGRNGAGKSTLLKILSRITEPTSGRAEIHGRVGSLLEVGTGFHPELTGRENIYLNGAILGMHRTEIDRKFDEIVAFAEIEKFLDTPVKHYSSGMYVRLAFAVAAHLDPEILLVDEVLAVGDVAFQKKCLGKMSEVAYEGRTVLFVSHNMAAVAHLCDHAVLLQDGELEYQGSPQQAISAYIPGRTAGRGAALGSWEVDDELLNRHRADETRMVIEGVDILPSDNARICRIGTGDPLRIRIHYYAPKTLISPAFVVSFNDRNGLELARLSTMPMGGFFISSLVGRGTIELDIHGLPFVGGVHFISVSVTRPNVEWICRLENLITLNIEPRDVYGSGTALDSRCGIVVLDHAWHLTEENVVV